MRVEGQTGSDGLLWAVCVERLGANWTEKGEGRIEWVETRSVWVAERV